jgi:hypothetical protein
MRFILAALTEVVLTMTAFAQPEDSLRKTYDALVAALKAKDVTAVAQLMNAENRNMLKEFIPASEHDAFCADALKSLPSPYEVRYVYGSKDGKKARMVVVGMAPVPLDLQKKEHLPPERRVQTSIVFELEAGAWKMAETTSYYEDDKRPRPADLQMGQRGDYGAEADTNLGGQIQRMEKQAAGTVYVISVVSEEDAVFLPTALVSPDFVPGAIVNFFAAVHGKDPLKYWAESAELVPFP